MIKKLIITILLAILTVYCFTWYCFAGTDKQINSIRDLEGTKIGVQTGTFEEQLVNELVKGKELYSFTALADGFAALKSGKIDALSCDNIVGLYLLSEIDMPYVTFDIDESEVYFAMITAKNDFGDKINGEINEFIHKIKVNGELDSLMDKWIYGKQKRTMGEYSALPNINGKITVATNAEYPPLEYLDNGKIVGYEIELAYNFCKEYGYALEIHDLPFNSIVDGVSNEKYDLGISGLTITEERKKSVNFTDAIIKSKVIIIAKDNPLNGGAVSIKKDSNKLSEIKESFNKTFIKQDRYKLFIKGALTTLEITIISLLLGTILAFLIYLICRNNNRIANGITAFCRWLIHGMPEVVLLMILFYVIFGKTNIAGIWVSIIAFTLTFTCSMFGMLESGERVIDEGQKEAAFSLGYGNWETYFRIILPQSAMHFLPSYKEEVVSHIKATAVVGYIAVQDITKIGDIIRGTTYEAMLPLLITAVMYFVMAGLLTTLIKFIIKMINPKRRSRKRILKGVEGI